MEGLSVAASIIQVIDVSSRLISNGIKIYKSQDGQTVEHRELEETTTSMTKDVQRLGRGLDKASRRGDLTDLEKEQENIGQQCQNIANELLETLRGLKYEGPRSPWKSFRQALASAWNDEKIRGLEHRLDRYRQQMITNVLSSLWLQSEKMSLQLDKALSQHAQFSTTPHIDENGFLGNNFLNEISTESRERWSSDLMEAILARSWEPQPTQLPSQPFIAYSHNNQDGNINFEDLFLQRLKFKDMMSRQLRIPKAHAETFRWIFCDTEDNGSKLKPEANFRNFLQNDQDKLYWVTGKPGSGKSTLMKYIHQNPETLEHLRVWQKKNKLVRASFYFWNSGSNLQMSIVGLLQTLLYDCLKQLPSAIPMVFPERWELFRLFEKHDPWQLEELQEALRSLILDKDLDAKFFIFIDGLDECSGDISSLIVFILGLCESSNHVKMCVASRPWAQFEDSFKKQPHLLLQDLTKEDIARYIASNLSANQGFHELAEREPKYAKQLRDEIAMKAQGVFLWVSLVVKSLLNGLTDGDGLRRLQQRLNEIPPDLEDLFRKILNGLEPDVKDHASRLFQLVRASREPPSVFTMALADLDDANYALTAPIEQMSESRKDSYEKNMRRKLSSRCRGLLEVNTHILIEKVAYLEGGALFPSNPHMHKFHYRELYECKVQYLHRTVKDFFEKPAVWDWLRSFNAIPFNPHLPLARSFLLQLKARPPEWLLSAKDLWNNVLWCISYAKEAELFGQGAQVALLDELNITATVLSEAPVGGTTFIQRHGTNSERRPHWTGTYFITTPGTSFLYLMTMCDMRGYLQEKLSGEEAQRIHKNKKEMSLLVAACYDFRHLSNWERGTVIFKRGPDLSLIQFLLDTGADPTHELNGRSALGVAGGQGDVHELLKRYVKDEPQRRRGGVYGDITTEIRGPKYSKVDSGKRRGQDRRHKGKRRRSKNGSRSTQTSSRNKSSLRTSRSHRRSVADTVKCVVM